MTVNPRPIRWKRAGQERLDGVLAGLGDLLRQRGDLAGARALYRRPLGEDPASLAAAAGLEALGP